MNYKMGVWFGDKALTELEAAALFDRFCSAESVRTENAAVYAFYNELGDRYAELEMLSEDEAENSPWACGHEHSGARVIMSIMSDRAAEVSLFIRSLARKLDLICFDPQENQVYLPAHLQPEETWTPAVAASHRLASA